MYICISACDAVASKPSEPEIWSAQQKGIFPTPENVELSDASHHSLMHHVCTQKEVISHPTPWPCSAI